ncbi:hypothetical protein BLNAU_5300 [Blattamonas nauphoetae]|uniref:Uncharacterized protein n=1 Tax=Blattamonas nauphoetae TaxID=2049346 RepID=A0ABQ9Y7V5_9EUKA|nr:hypothetical protein BLNAU_5300 [Blattamonas nauphoetae]
MQATARRLDSAASAEQGVAGQRIADILTDGTRLDGAIGDMECLMRYSRSPVFLLLFLPAKTDTRFAGSADGLLVSSLLFLLFFDVFVDRYSAAGCAELMAGTTKEVLSLRMSLGSAIGIDTGGVRKDSAASFVSCRRCNPPAAPFPPSVPE